VIQARYQLEYGMDNKTIFARTSKGEDEMQSRTSHLPGDIKRALLMVDGSATFGEISKRAAPSMRASLGEMFQELEKSGFIQDKAMAGKTPKMAVPPKMVVPTKMATPHKKQAVDDDAGELDFMSGFTASPPEAPTAEAVKAEKLRAEAEEKSKQEIAAEKIKAQREAAAILLKAEQEAARIREVTARRAKEEAETTRLKAEQEARKVRDELEAVRLKTEQESKLRLEVAARERQQAEAARLIEEQEARKVRDELETARLKTEQESKLRAVREQQQAEAARLIAEQEARKVRDELEELVAARLKAEQETKLRLEAAVREQQQAEAARVKAEQEAAQMHIELEATKLRAEQEAKARLEAATKAHARIKAEEEVAKAREAVELIAKQQREAAQAREVAGAQAAQTTEAAPAAKPDAFTFDSFHVDEPQRPAELHKDQQPAQKASAAQQPSDAAKTTQPADVRQPVRQQVPPPVASEPVESKPSQEQIKREAQERIAAEQRIAAEAKQAKELADAQAKVWAEAEQRALEVAKANAERAAHQAEYPVADTSHVEKPVPVPRVQRKPFAWGRLVGFVFKLGVFLLVLLVGALFIVPYVLPMRDYMPKVQQLLSEKLHQPVHLGYLSGRILPTPRLELGEIYIGEVKQFQAKEAQINFDITGLFGDKKPISSVEFQDVKVSSAGLQNATAWLQQLAHIDQYPVSRMVISQGTLDADAFQLTGVEGELNFNPVGKFTQANLRANAGKFTLDINATPEDKLQVAITVRGSALPLLPNWSFDELNAKGALSNDELQISDFDARILGGVVQGNASINWRSGWRAQGALNAKTITMQKLSKLLDGNVEGSARFKMTSMDLAGLTDSVVLDGSFTANNGMISGMDIVETARMRSRENLPGGRTHFDGLSGLISYANNAYHFKQVKVAAGVLNATATFDVTKQQLSGKMSVRLSMHDGTAPVDLQMGGAIDSPTLRYAP
jgi:hypothetical protein